MKDGSSSNTAIKVAIITGVIALTAAFIGIIPDLLDRIPKNSATLAQVETAIPTTTEVVPSTSTAEPSVVSPTQTTEPFSKGLPTGYVMYEDFNTENAFNNNWSMEDPKRICTLTLRDGSLFFDCQNKTKNDLMVSLLPSKQFAALSGVAALVTVRDVFGPYQLTTEWKCAAETPERAYHLRLVTNNVEALEFYPLEGWRSNSLGTIAVSPNLPHQLQIEATGGQLSFQVDGKDLPLTTAPDFDACLTLDNWAMDFPVLKDDHRNQGQVDWVGIKP
jgi:hypothetical protein